jgi:hypothetical protein
MGGGARAGASAQQASWTRPGVWCKYKLYPAWSTPGPQLRRCGRAAQKCCICSERLVHMLPAWVTCMHAWADLNAQCPWRPCQRPRPAAPAPPPCGLSQLRSAEPFSRGPARHHSGVNSVAGCMRGLWSTCMCEGGALRCVGAKQAGHVGWRRSGTYCVCMHAAWLSAAYWAMTWPSWFEGPAPQNVHMQCGAWAG